MSLYKINDVELEIDMEDYDFQKRYEDAFEKVAQEEKELQKVGKNSEITKKYCEMFYHLFDGIFGEGTGDRLFEGKYNIRKTDDIYDEFIQICSDQAKEARHHMDSMINKYKPKNRTGKRTK